ncbi:type II toxin-antitoxin system VapB family antitoxin [Aurantimonas sp. C2-6-R+9]|uniref:type II toxin-antitoxin system VapB family antitoxin n=2 Tax=Aurantimonas TaxID=182269 RepID=UPI002E181BF0|nr:MULTISPECIES: type II toxin-antitoxin system VapB family antitoxin [unclassified Aurantimonas]MEC5290078.1 type II toxin-antitoxin system VapB family antitoxin [Aurantimonas sp. C2-3-R2]MEC5380191.1 type II toxin-antitoxin system VapB family antitoxin [Aurantimonas sp. C2-6-R+9]MEC5411142.1 type II toxin-antitoxin system VapB family antitoxin [Aurantimonas sp. C2-4-R8]
MMALYIRDPEVDELARKLRAMTGAKSKTDAVRRALRNELRRARRPERFDDRNAKVMAMADALGSSQTLPFDMKAFTDAMWDDA